MPTIATATIDSAQIEARARALVEYSDNTISYSTAVAIASNTIPTTTTDPASTGVTVPRSTEDAELINGMLEDVVSFDPVFATMRKLTKEQLQEAGYDSLREIRSPAARPVPDERAFIIQMVDRNFTPYGMLAKDTVVTALKLLPNPNTANINSSKIVNRYQTMTRWVEEHWGDEMDTLSFSGSTYSFFAYTSGGTASQNVGLTVNSRNDTKAYEMLRELVTFFTYNGCLYQDNRTYEGMTPAYISFRNDTDNKYFLTNHPRTGMIKERLYISLYYDYFSLLGYFDTFDIAEESNSPYRMTYNAIFKAERTKWHQGNLARLSASNVSANQISTPLVSSPGA